MWRPSCFSKIAENQYQPSYWHHRHANKILWWYLNKFPLNDRTRWAADASRITPRWNTNKNYMSPSGGHNKKMLWCCWWIDVGVSKNILFPAIFTNKGNFVLSLWSLWFSSIWGSVHWRCVLCRPIFHIYLESWIPPDHIDVYYIHIPSLNINILMNINWSNEEAFMVESTGNRSIQHATHMNVYRQNLRHRIAS